MRSVIFIAAALTTFAYAEDSSSTTSASATGTTGVPATSTYDVKVGADGLKFDPESLTASPGDLVNFHFFASNHSVAQSSFDKPCQPLDGDKGIFSGFFTASGKDEASQVFSMRMNDTEPVWLYCSSGDHCKGGQSMVINPPSNSDQTLKKYKEESKKAEVKNPANVNGGVVREKPSSSAAASSSASPSSSNGIKKSAAPVNRVAAASSVGLLAAVAGALMLL